MSIVPNKYGDILTVIPARKGSKGVPGKNFKTLRGKPLIVWSIEAAIQSTGLKFIVVSTDSEDIMNLEDQFPNVVFLQRPVELARDDTPTLPVIQHALRETSFQAESVCILQPTSPFRPEGFIDRAISVFEDLNCDSLVSVLEVPQEYNPHWTFLKDEKGFLKIATGESKVVSRRQELPKAYFRDGSIYLSTVENILKKERLLGDQLGYVVSDPDFFVNIDEPADWKRAEAIAQKWKL